MSASDRPPDAVIWMLRSAPVALSLAVTLRMPLASMSNVTSICGTPRGAGGMPSSWNLPSVLLSFAIGRSPWVTWTVDGGLVVGRGREGLGLARRDRGVARDEHGGDAAVGLDASDSGVTSSSRMSLTSPVSTPPWTAAPSATTSSGLTERLGSLPKNSLTFCCTIGMRVEPPTSTTSWMSAAFLPASASAFGTAPACARRRSIIRSKAGRPGA
jgi:hypothetical protein